MSGPFEMPDGHRYMRMTTYRKSGEAVPTTVWFAIVDGRVYVFTDLHSGKAKRIRNNPRVMLTTSNFIGRPRVRSSIETETRFMDKDDLADRAIREKIGWQYSFLFVLGLPRNPPEHVFLELSRVEDGAGLENSPV